MKTRNVIIGITAGLVVLLVALLLGGSLWGRNYCHHGPGMMWDSGFGGGILIVLFWVFLLALLVGGGALLASRVTRRDAKGVEAEEAPLEILKRRYARGEIDREEFQRMREVLVSESDG